MMNGEHVKTNIVKINTIFLKYVAQNWQTFSSKKSKKSLAAADKKQLIKEVIHFILQVLSPALHLIAR